MKKLFLFFITLLTINIASAQEDNGGKVIWAKSFLNEKAPEFKIEKWVTKEPNLKDKFVLIEFWATWCGPCRKAIPKLNAIQKKFADDLVVIGISDEAYEQVADMISPKIEYTSAIDTRALLKDEYEVKGIPHAVLITPKGTVIWEGFPLLSGHELTEEVIEKLIEKYKDK